MSTSSLSGWHARAKPHPDGARYEPTSNALSVAAIHSLPAFPEDFTLALFAPRDAVDARGVALTLEQSDWDGLVRAARAAVEDVPPSGAFRNQWQVKQERTSQPIDRLLVKKKDSADGFDEVGVSGYSEQTRELKKPVGGFTELPEPLFEAFGLVLEAREGFVRGEEDAELIAKVKTLLGDSL